MTWPGLATALPCRVLKQSAPSRASRASDPDAVSRSEAGVGGKPSTHLRAAAQWDGGSVEMFVEAPNTLTTAGRPVPPRILTNLREWLVAA